MTINTWKKYAIKVLSNISTTPALDVNLILMHETGLTKTQLLLKENDLLLTDEQLAKLNDALDKRKSGLAIPYITGNKEFYGNNFLVTRDTLYPRSDTEILVDCAIEFLQKISPSNKIIKDTHYNNLIYSANTKTSKDIYNKSEAKIKKSLQDSPISVLDLCTGTACVGVSIALNIKIDKLVLSDISRAALDVAKKNVNNLLKTRESVNKIENHEFYNLLQKSNAANLSIKNITSNFNNLSYAGNTIDNKNAVTSNEDKDLTYNKTLNNSNFNKTTDIKILQSDLFENLNGEVFNLIVSNPPYIKQSEALKLLSDGRGDPLTALAGDGNGSNDGLFFVRRILDDAKKHLKPGGALFIECGDDNINAAACYAKNCGYKNIKIIKDLAGDDRVLKMIV